MSTTDRRGPGEVSKTVPTLRSGAQPHNANSTHSELLGSVDQP
jgi:hypothetical protein